MAHQLVRLDQRSNFVSELFKTNKGFMVAGAPKSAGDPMRLLNIAFNAIAFDPKLLECTQESLIGGVFEALKLGITLGGPMQQGWLIPFNVKGRPTATLIVGYMGLRDIIDRAGAVRDMQPYAVHNGRHKVGNEWQDGTPDEFSYWYGDEPRIIHKPRNPEPTQAQQLQAVYIVANLRNNGRQRKVLEIGEIEAHRLRSRAKDSGPWQTDYVQMALKTAVRVIAKNLPKSNELLARALQLDNDADRGEGQSFEIPHGVTFLDETTGGPKNVTPKSPMDRLKQQHGIGKQTENPPVDDGLTDEERREIIEQDAETARQERESQ